MPAPSPALADAPDVDAGAPAGAAPAESASAGDASAEEDRRDRTRGVLYMLASALGFSVMSLCVKLASAELPTMEIVFARSAFMAAVTFAALRRSGASVLGYDRPTLLARGVVGATALSLLYFGLSRLPLGDSVTIHYTAPVWTALSAAVLLGERLRPLVLAGAALSLVGVALVAQPTFLFGAAPDPLDGWGVAAVVAGSVLSGLAYTFVRKLRATDDPMTIIFYLSWVGAVGSLPFALGGWAWPSPVGWALVLGIGLSTQVGQVCLTKGIHLLEAGTATAIGYVQIVFAFAWGVLVFGDPLDPLSVAGAVLVVSSVLFIARRG